MTDRREIFKAAEEAAAMAWGEGCYWNGIGKIPEEWNGIQLHDTRQSLPQISRGAIACTGLAIYVSNHVPAWLETPWGEWYCWGNSFSLRHVKNEALGNFLERFAIDYDLSTAFQGNNGTWPSRFGRAVIEKMGSIELPPYKSMGPDEALLQEWVQFRKEHVLP